MAMATFELRTQSNGIETTVKAFGRSGRYVIETPTGPVQAPALADALRRAAEHIGPVLARAARTDSAWGLYVTAGGAHALFGEWIPADTRPQFVGDPPTRKTKVSRIYYEWKNHDGTPIGALEAAVKIIELYAERSEVRAA